jgi:hypothetical protein
MDRDRVTGFLTLVTHYLKIDLRPFLASLSHVKNILGVEGGYCPLQTPKPPNPIGGTIPYGPLPLDVPFERVGAEKLITF